MSPFHSRRALRSVSYRLVWTRTILICWQKLSNFSLNQIMHPPITAMQSSRIACTYCTTTSLALRRGLYKTDRNGVCITALFGSAMQYRINAGLGCVSWSRFWRIPEAGAGSCNLDHLNTLLRHGWDSVSFILSVKLRTLYYEDSASVINVLLKRCVRRQKSWLEEFQVKLRASRDGGCP